MEDTERKRTKEEIVKWKRIVTEQLNQENVQIKRLERWARLFKWTHRVALLAAIAYLLVDIFQ